MMLNIMSKILNDNTMDNILNMAKEIAQTAAAEKKAIASTFVGFIIGGLTIYLYVRRTTNRPNTILNRSNVPAPLIQPAAIDPVTGRPKITPQDKIVHKAPERYGSAAPGPHSMEIHEEVALQAARDAEEEADANPLRTSSQARDASVEKSIVRVRELSEGLPDREVAQGRVVKAVRGTGIVGEEEEHDAGEGVVAGYGHGGEGSNEDVETSSDKNAEEVQERGSRYGTPSLDEGSWDEEMLGPRNPREG
ncbi:hypothetical protein IQ06DRAFT_303938 [Phaeosphaeriaceae sp. SRC1lsM3a]|nr:hypothetical protein IQ06DRAFT_303938 [Stagonospora sp. SRC1lsM3a]